MCFSRTSLVDSEAKAFITYKQVGRDRPMVAVPISNRSVLLSKYAAKYVALRMADCLLRWCADRRCVAF